MPKRYPRELLRCPIGGCSHIAAADRQPELAKSSPPREMGSGDLLICTVNFALAKAQRRQGERCVTFDPSCDWHYLSSSSASTLPWDFSGQLEQHGITGNILRSRKDQVMGVNEVYAR